MAASVAPLLTEREESVSNCPATVVAPAKLVEPVADRLVALSVDPANVVTLPSLTSGPVDKPPATVSDEPL